MNQGAHHGVWGADAFAVTRQGTISSDVGLQPLENKALSRGSIGKSAPTLAEITIRKSQDILSDCGTSRVHEYRRGRALDANRSSQSSPTHIESRVCVDQTEESSCRFRWTSPQRPLDTSPSPPIRTASARSLPSAPLRHTSNLPPEKVQRG